MTNKFVKNVNRLNYQQQSGLGQSDVGPLGVVQQMSVGYDDGRVLCCGAAVGGQRNQLYYQSDVVPVQDVDSLNFVVDWYGFLQQESLPREGDQTAIVLVASFWLDNAPVTDTREEGDDVSVSVVRVLELNLLQANDVRSLECQDFSLYSLPPKVPVQGSGLTFPVELGVGQHQVVGQDVVAQHRKLKLLLLLLACVTVAGALATVQTLGFFTFSRIFIFRGFFHC